MSWLWFALLLPLVGATALRSRSLGDSTNDRSEGIRCRVLSVDVQLEQTQGTKTSDTMFRCLTEEPSGMTYSLELPNYFMDQRLDSGETYVTIPNAHVDNSTTSIQYPPNATILTTPPTRRRLSVEERRKGIKKMLVIRVLGSDTSNPTFSHSDLSKRIFGIGTGAPSVNVQSQLNACSFGKFQVTPASGNHISNGVITIAIPKVKGQDPFNLENIVVSAVESKLGLDLEENFGHVMICLPPGTKYQGTNSVWYAYGYLNWYRTVYNDDTCGYYSFPVHEIGHNLRLHHSNEGSTQYGDQTGMMGYSYKNYASPSMCFNGHKNWLLGWYGNKATEIDVSNDPWSGRLYAFVDYKRAPSGSLVLIRIKDLFLQYNRGRSFNSGTKERKNQVTIVRGLGDNDSSKLVGGVALGVSGAKSIHVVSGLDGKSDLVIEACEQTYGPPDYVRLSIYLDDGKGSQSSTCNVSPTNRPTSPPTRRPTKSPTRRPTNSPTALPTTAGPPQVCDDSTESFKLDPNKSTKITCSDLRTNNVLRTNLCVASHEAYKLCKETCGVCTDDCHDSKQEFYVNRNYPEQDCAWLEDRPRWRQFLCYPTHEVHDICGETCNSCDGYPTPPPPPFKNNCDDDADATFYVDELDENKDCEWLAKKPIWHSRYCAPDRESFDLCEETCRKCVDNCEDEPDAKFYVNQDHGEQDCEWLSESPGWMRNLCNNDNRDVKTLCKETCNRC